MKKRSRTGVTPGYPSILDLALKAGKWSFVAGSSALVIGSAACGPIQTAGVLELDASEDPGQGRDYILGGDDVVIQDIPTVDTGLFADPGNDYIAALDVAPADAGAFADEWVDPDPGLNGDDVQSFDPGLEARNDIQDPDDGIDQGPTPGLPYEEDVQDHDDSVQAPDNAGDVQE